MSSCFFVDCAGLSWLSDNPNPNTHHNPPKTQKSTAFSDPASVIRRAAAEGYRVADFAAAPLPFGAYSSQREVKEAIEALHAQGRAFFGARQYMIAGALFVRKEQRRCDGDGGGEEEDLSAALLYALSALR